MDSKAVYRNKNMKLKIIIWIIASFLLASPVFAGWQNDNYNEAIMIATFDNNVTQDNSTFNQLLEQVGATYQTSPALVGSGAVDLTGADDYVQRPDNDNAMQSQTNRTVACWIRGFGGAGAETQKIIAKDLGNPQTGFNVNYVQGTTSWAVTGHYDPEYPSITPSDTAFYNSDVYELIVYTVNHSAELKASYYFYHNTTILGESTNFDTTGLFGNSIPIRFGWNNKEEINDANTDYDECIIINKSWSSTDVENYYTLTAIDGKHLTAEEGDVTAPTIDATSINDTSPYLNEDVQISATSSDETALSFVFYANNISGTWTNISFIDITDAQTTLNYSVNITNTALYPNVTGHIFTVNDTSDNSVQSSVILFETQSVDTTNPLINSTSVNNSAPKINEVVGLSALVYDETALDWVTIAHNQSGTMTNQTLVDISGSSINATHSLTITASKNTVIGFSWWVNDTSGNAKTSAVETITVANTPPSNPTIIYPTADLRTNEQPLIIQVTYPADADNDAMTIYYYINETLNQTSVNNVSYYASDGYYNLDVSITDGEEFSANVSVNFEIDTVNPILTVNSPTATAYTTNISINATCTDTNPFILNYTFYNSTYEIIQSGQDNTPVGNLLEIYNTIDITNLPDGSYFANFSCSDSHTKNEIDNYYITYQTNGIMYDTAEGNRIKILQIGKPATPSTSKRTDRYVFNFGTSEEIEQRTYKVISTWHDITVIEDSDYNAHLVVWNGDKGNWIDFESSDAQIISVERINPRHIEITVWATDFNFKSIGGLNIVTESIALTIGAEVPVVEEEDAVLSAVLLLGSIGLMIAFIVIMLISLYKTFKREK